jgi:hypothetical protein
MGILAILAGISTRIIFHFVEQEAIAPINLAFGIIPFIAAYFVYNNTPKKSVIYSLAALFLISGFYLNMLLNDFQDPGKGEKLFDFWEDLRFVILRSRFARAGLGSTGQSRGRGFGQQPLQALIAGDPGHRIHPELGDDGHQEVTHFGKGQLAGSAVGLRCGCGH